MNETEFLARWTAEKAIYTAWGELVVAEILSTLAAQHAGVDPDVFIKIPPKPRLKGDDSILGKAFHRNKPYANPYEEIEDKVGVRFVVLLGSDIARLQRVIESSDTWDASLDKDFEQDREQRPLEFAYQSKHYVLKARGAQRWRETEIPAGTPCEVQLRTLLQHAHSELTHDNIYKVQSGTIVGSNVHRTVAKSMALIEAVDDFFERAIEQLGEATASERNAMTTLRHLYERHVDLPAGNDQSNALVLHAFRDHLAPDLHGQVEALLDAKPFILNAYFSPSWTAFQADRGRHFSVIVDGVSN